MTSPEIIVIEPRPPVVVVVTPPGGTPTGPDPIIIENGRAGEPGHPGADSTVPGPPGPQGVRGLPGPTGPPATIPPLAYVHDQGSPSDLWVIDHNLGYRPAVTVVDSGGGVVIGDETYLDANTVEIRFVAPFGGKAYLS